MEDRIELLVKLGLERYQAETFCKGIVNETVEDAAKWMKESFHHWSGYYDGEDFVVYSGGDNVDEMIETFREDMSEY